jgi:hypothetical protein
VTEPACGRVAWIFRSVRYRPSEADTVPPRCCLWTIYLLLFIAFGLSLDSKRPIRGALDPRIRCPTFTTAMAPLGGISAHPSRRCRRPISPYHERRTSCVFFSTRLISNTPSAPRVTNHRLVSADDTRHDRVARRARQVSPARRGVDSSGRIWQPRAPSRACRPSLAIGYTGERPRESGVQRGDGNGWA